MKIIYSINIYLNMQNSLHSTNSFIRKKLNNAVTVTHGTELTALVSVLILYF